MNPILRPICMKAIFKAPSKDKEQSTCRLTLVISPSSLLKIGFKLFRQYEFVLLVDVIMK